MNDTEAVTVTASVSIILTRLGLAKSILPLTFLTAENTQRKMEQTDRRSPFRKSQRLRRQEAYL